MKTAILLSTLLLAGCTVTRAPMDVSALPNDCANQSRIVTWLNTMATQPQHPLESDSDYEATRRYYRTRIWHLRYVCNPT